MVSFQLAEGSRTLPSSSEEVNSKVYQVAECSCGHYQVMFDTQSQLVELKEVNLPNDDIFAADNTHLKGVVALALLAAPLWVIVVAA